MHRRAVGFARQIIDRLVPVPTRRLQRQAPVAPRHLASHRDLAPASRHSTSLVERVASFHPWFRDGSRLRLQRRLIRVRLGGERALPMTVALAVIVAGVVSLGPSVAKPVGAAQGQQGGVRLAVGGSDGTRSVDQVATDPSVDNVAAYVNDGTFYKPVAVDTTVESGSDLLQHYSVKAGDTLTGIAAKFGVSAMTIWWANKLDSKDSLHLGQVLVIPPVNGLVITVKAGDTLAGLAATYNVDPDSIMTMNNLSDPNLIVGQVLILPGARGAPIPTPKPAPRQQPSSSSSSNSGHVSYTGGTFLWPVPGGYISQYFHYYHLGIDIAAPYGSPIVAAHAGKIVFSGWKNTGCGWEVWIYIGNNIYLQNCHMSSLGVSAGQYVSRGQFIGRIGMSGDATGPHDHFAVSIGVPFTSGAYFVNPLNYF
ncbi:MAG TPA: LysM peptidoglycan-binding domain-containing protein [Candidatus Limnocylindrales bacterium]|nr:LysM peptidoglycan-binding domain-containing protein [Candidatus Limnocylindrales bacterium]